jgi:hypothetical protein
MEYLGIIVGKGKTCIDLKRLLAVSNYSTPVNIMDVHVFLRLTGYY